MTAHVTAAKPVNELESYNQLKLLIKEIRTGVQPDLSQLHQYLQNQYLQTPDLFRARDLLLRTLSLLRDNETFRSNFVEIVAQLDQAIQSGNAVAMFNRAFIFQMGLESNGKPDYVEAATLYERAITLDNVHAMNSRAYMFYLGQGSNGKSHYGKPDYVKAAALYEQAMALGDVAAMAARAFMFQNGLGSDGKPDYVKAVALHEQAMVLGDAAAMANRAFMFQQGQGSDGKPDYVKAVALFDQVLCSMISSADTKNYARVHLANISKEMVLSQILSLPAASEERKNLLWGALQLDTALGKFFRVQRGFRKPNIHIGSLQIILAELRKTDSALADLYVDTVTALEAGKAEEKARVLVRINASALNENDKTDLKNLRHEKGPSLGELEKQTVALQERFSAANYAVPATTAAVSGLTAPSSSLYPSPIEFGVQYGHEHNEPASRSLVSPVNELELYNQLKLLIEEISTGVQPDLSQLHQYLQTHDLLNNTISLLKNNETFLFNFVEIVAQLDQAIQSRNAVAMFNRAYMFQVGLGSNGNPDYAKAAALYEQAMALRNAYAINNRAFMFQQGQGSNGKPDYAKAAELFEHAMALGSAYAMNNRAYMFQRGQGSDGKPDYVKAAELFEQAMALGDASAMVNRAYMFQHGQGSNGKPDYVKAVALFDQVLCSMLSSATTKNHARAHFANISKEMVLSQILSLPAASEERKNLLWGALQLDTALSKFFRVRRGFRKPNIHVGSLQIILTELRKTDGALADLYVDTVTALETGKAEEKARVLARINASALNENDKTDLKNLRHEKGPSLAELEKQTVSNVNKNRDNPLKADAAVYIIPDFAKQDSSKSSIDTVEIRPVSSHAKVQRRLPALAAGTQNNHHASPVSSRVQQTNPGALARFLRAPVPSYDPYQANRQRPETEADKSQLIELDDFPVTTSPSMLPN